jgi:hypothetical protein
MGEAGRKRDSQATADADADADALKRGLIARQRVNMPYEDV